MKLLAIPFEKDFSCDLVDGYILPLEGYSVSYFHKYSLDEIRLCVQFGKEVFVVMNKNIFNHEVEDVKKVLRVLSEMSIKGVFFYDLAILSIVQRCNFDLPLIWNQTNMVTNYNTVNYYASKGVFGAMFSNEITLDEMVEIRKKTEAKLFANIIYRPIMSFSRRSLITNFKKNAGICCEQRDLIVHEKISDENLIVREETDGTSFFYGKIVNGLSALSVMVKESFDYGIIDLSVLSKDCGDLSLNISRNIVDGKEPENISKVSDLIGDYTGFLYKRTIYKVK